MNSTPGDGPEVSTHRGRKKQGQQRTDPQSATTDVSARGTQSKDHVAIIGGGIAGLFCAYVLAAEGHRVDLFESSPVFGGRIRSIRLRDELLKGLENKSDGDREGLVKEAILEKALNIDEYLDTDYHKRPWDHLEFCPEFGPMRIELEVQVLLKLLLDHLDISGDNPELPSPRKDLASLDLVRMEQFPPFSSPASIGDPVYDLKPEEEGKNPLELLKLGLCRAVVDLKFGPEMKDDTKVIDSSDLKMCTEFTRKRDLLIFDLAKAAGTHRPTNPVFEAWLKTLNENDYWVIQRYGNVPVLYASDSLYIDLYTMGFWNLMAGYLSHNALSKVRDLGTFYHLLPQNPNAAEWLTWWLRQVAISKQLQGVFGGMQSVTEKLIREMGIKTSSTKTDSLKSGNSKFNLTLHRKITVTHLTLNEAKDKIFVGVKLEETNKTFEPAKISEGFDRVIMALPKVPAQKIAEKSPSLWGEREEKVARLLDSALAFPLVKVFFVVRERWWEQAVRANLEATRYPTREIYFWKSRLRDSRRGLVMLYTDRPASSFWANYVPAGKQLDISELCSPDEKILRARLKSRFVEYVNEAEGLDITDDDIIWCGIMDWGREPYAAASHAWRPERPYWETLAEFADIALGSDASSAHLHICGEAYSDYHAFIEGALRSAIYVLTHIPHPSKSSTGSQARVNDILTELLKPKSRDSRDEKYVEDLVALIDKLDEIGGRRR